MKDFIYCLIFPHSLNNHRARFLHPKSILTLISFFILWSLFFSGGYSPFAEKLRAYAEISIQELVTFTNQKRAENGLAPLAQNTKLSEAAGKKADDMFAKNYWAHNSPDGVTPWVFIKDSGYNYVYAGENLARGFNNSSDVVDAWMASSTHRTNILSSNYKDVGFAVKSGSLNGEQTFVVVQEFGSSTLLPAVKKDEISKPKISASREVLGLPSFSKSAEVAIFLILGIIVVLLIDLILTERRKITRFVGHNLDHAVFLSVIVLVICLFNAGVVL